MNLIIDHARIKRRIEGAFRICGDSQQLTQIANQILEQTKGQGFFGWVEIADQADESLPYTKPLPWAMPGELMEPAESPMDIMGKKR